MARGGKTTPSRSDILRCTRRLHLTRPLPSRHSIPVVVHLFPRATGNRFETAKAWPNWEDRTSYTCDRCSFHRVRPLNRMREVIRAAENRQPIPVQAVNVMHRVVLAICARPQG